MSSSEPPSRIPPRGQNQDTKAARDELSSKGKVEKVREVDADETRKRKFLKFYKEEEPEETDTLPSPFDLYSQKKSMTGEDAPSSMTARGPSMGDVEDAIVPSPPYSPPPTVSPSFNTGEEEEESNQATSGALPKSNDFWEDVDFPPDRPVPPQQFQETTRTRKPGEAPSKPGKKEAGPSLFGPPGKSVKPEKPVTAQPKKEKKEAASFEAPPIPQGRSPEKKKEPSPFEIISKPLEKEEERYLAPKTEKKRPKEKVKEEEKYLTQEPGIVPLKPEEREGGGGGQKGRDQKIVENDVSNLPSFTPHIQPQAVAATVHAAPFLNPSTISLFFQMVGTMYGMASPGINRTEIVLNNPAYANSKFFGATITIEKYATAPDSFNIRLTGSDQAVASFKENIPSLMSSFQNGDFTFKVNRLDVEYSTERPVYRRREKGEGRGQGKDAGGGDLGERRK